VNVAAYRGDMVSCRRCLRFQTRFSSAEVLRARLFTGLSRLCSDFQFMLGYKPGAYWRITWGFCAPLILSVIFIYSLIDYKPLKYENYDYPDWADGMGWMLALCSMGQIPVWAIVQICRQNGNSFSEVS